MWHLIKKDIMLCRMGIFFLVVLSFFTGPLSIILMDIITFDSVFGIFTLVFYLFIGFILTMGLVLERETKVDGDVILYSIPVDRALIVKSRYASAALFTLSQSLAYLIYSYIAKWTKGFRLLGIRLAGEVKSIRIFNIMIALSIVMFLVGSYLVIYYSNKDKRDKVKATVGTIYYLLLIVLPAIGFRFWDKIKGHRIVRLISFLNNEVVITIGFLLSIGIYLLFMKVAIKKTKEN